MRRENLGLWNLIIPELHVLVLTKRHVDSGNEIDLLKEWIQGSAHTRSDSAQIKFVGLTLNSKSRTLSVAIFFNPSLFSFIRRFDRAQCYCWISKVQVRSYVFLCN